MSDDEDPENEAAARVGVTLKGKWQLKKLLGVGGMCAVYEGHHRNGARFAIKILHARYAADVEVRRRFQREGYLANSVEHAGSVRVFDDDVEDGMVFLVMELLHGRSLESARERAGGVLPVEEALSITERVLDVLAAAHDKGIIHRDITPANIFITSTGEIKVLDFGIAGARSSFGSVLTAPGSIMGTPAFMAPEQARGDWERVDGRSDLYSVGSTLFKVLSGVPVHWGTTTNEQFALTMTVQARSLRTVLPDADDKLVAFVDRALRFDPDERFSSARAMRNACLELLGRPVASPEPDPPPAPLAAVDVGKLQAENASTIAVSGQSAAQSPAKTVVSRTTALALTVVALALGAGFWFVRSVVSPSGGVAAEPALTSISPAAGSPPHAALNALRSSAGATPILEPAPSAPAQPAASAAASVSSATTATSSAPRSRAVQRRQPRAGSSATAVENPLDIRR